MKQCPPLPKAGHTTSGDHSTAMTSLCGRGWFMFALVCISVGIRLYYFESDHNIICSPNGLELKVPLLQTPKCWNCTHVPTCLAKILLNRWYLLNLDMQSPPFVRRNCDTVFAGFLCRKIISTVGVKILLTELPVTTEPIDKSGLRFMWSARQPPCQVRYGLGTRADKK